MSDTSCFRLYDVRPPRFEDAADLGRLHNRVWRETYEGMMHAQVLRALDDARTAQRWRQIAAQEAEGLAAQEGSVTRVAVEPSSGVLVGFGTVAPARAADAPVDVELWALNVLPEFHGTGAAGQLLAATLGSRAAYLWVVEGNLRAQAFYRKHGFEPDGGRERDERLGADEIRMVRR